MRDIHPGGRSRSPNPWSMRFVPVLVTALICAACGSDGASETGTPGVEATVRDSGGVQIVTNRGEGWLAEGAWRLEPDFQVGELDGPYSFGRIAWVSPGRDGEILVLDSQTQLVHVFDSAGIALATFGGEGDGPGEFRRPAAVTPTEDGRIAVSQGFPPVLHWLTLRGDYLESTRLPIARDEAGTRTAGTFGLWQVTREGGVFVQVQVIDPGAEDGEMPVALLQADPTGEAPPDTIAEWTWRPGFGDQAIRVFEPVYTWMPRSDGIVVLSSGSPYEVRWHDPSAGLVRIMRREVDPAPATARHRERATEDMREAMASGGAPEDRIDDLLENLAFESELPEVLRIWVSQPDGRLWIGVHDTQLFDQGFDTAQFGMMNALDVFERDGRYLGRVPLPEGFTLRVVTEDALYGVWEDELEVPFARRYRVVRPVTD